MALLMLQVSVSTALVPLALLVLRVSVLAALVPLAPLVLQVSVSTLELLCTTCEKKRLLIG